MSERTDNLKVLAGISWYWLSYPAYYARNFRAIRRWNRIGREIQAAEAPRLQAQWERLREQNLRDRVANQPPS